jgi:hypothetical protein
MAEEAHGNCVSLSDSDHRYTMRVSATPPAPMPSAPRTAFSKRAHASGHKTHGKRRVLFALRDTVVLAFNVDCGTSSANVLGNILPL